MAEDAGGGSPGPNRFQVHQAAVARFHHEPVDLDGAMDDLQRVLQRAICRLRDEVLQMESSPAGERNTAISDGFARRLKEVTTALAATVSGQKALWSSAKERAGRLSPEERRAALAASILKLPYLERRNLILDLCRRHTAGHRAAVETGAEPRLADTQSPITLTMVEVA